MDTYADECMHARAHTHTLTPTLTPQTHIRSQPAVPCRLPQIILAPCPPPIIPFSPPLHPLLTPSPLSTLCSAPTCKKKTYLGEKHMNMCWSKKDVNTKQGVSALCVCVCVVLTHIHSHTCKNKTCNPAPKHSSIVIFSSCE